MTIILTSLIKEMREQEIQLYGAPSWSMNEFYINNLNYFVYYTHHGYIHIRTLFII